MSLTLTTATTQVRDLLNEDAEVFWSNTEIEQWIKEGCRDFSTKTLMVEAEGTLSLVTNQIIYAQADAAFIANVLEPYAALYNDGVDNWKGILKSHPKVIGNEATNKPGDPKFYSLHNRKIYIWPKPTATMVAAGAYISLLYSKSTENIADLMDEFQHLPLYYAAARCKWKDQKFAEGNALMSMYASFSNFERSDKHAREEDTLDMFKMKSRGAQRGAT